MILTPMYNTTFMLEKWERINANEKSPNVWYEDFATVLEARKKGRYLCLLTWI